MIPDGTLDDFYEITGFDIGAYFSDFAVFYNAAFASFVDYYSGDLEIVPSKYLLEYERLAKLERELKAVLAYKRDDLSNAKYWELVIVVEQVSKSLDTIANLDKWQRSSRQNAFFASTAQVNATLKQGVTLEKFTVDVLGSSDVDDWSNIAIRNDLAEDGYTVDDVLLLKAEFRGSYSSVQIQSVVDVINGENVYGKDINRQLAFVDNDLEVLTPKESMVQAVEILASLTKGDNPAFPSDGIQAGVGANRNLTSTTFPVVFRQMADVFRTDDTLKAFVLRDVYIEQDSVFYEFEVQTRLDELLTTKVRI